MAEKAGKINSDEFSDLDPVLDEDSFTFDFEDESALASNNEEMDIDFDPGLDPPSLEDFQSLDTADDSFDFDSNPSDSVSEDESSLSASSDENDEFGLDSMVSSVGDEYPSTNSDSLDLDLDAGLNLIDEDLNSIEPNSLSADSEASSPSKTVQQPNSEKNPIINTQSESHTSKTDTNESSMDDDIEIDDDDPLIDEKIDQIVNAEEDNSKIESKNNSSYDSDFTFDDLEEDDEPITLSFDELENIASTSSKESSDDESFDSDFDELESNEFESAPTNKKESSYTDEELDHILGTDIFEEDEKESGLLNLESTDLDMEFDEPILEESKPVLSEEEDMSDEPIALSMDELQNIMEQGEAGSESESLALDLDTDTPPEVTTDDLDFTDFDEDSETKEDLFSDEDTADEPITLSLDELENIASTKKSDSTGSEESELVTEDEFDFIDDPEFEPTPKNEIESETELDGDFDSISSFDEDSDSDIEESSELDLNDTDTSEDAESNDDLFTAEDLADEPITLSMDELSNITALEEESETMGSAFDDTLPEDTLSIKPNLGWDEEESIATSDDIEKSDDFDFDSIDDDSIESTKEEIEEMEKDLSIDLTSDDEADEPITLSVDELSAITSEDLGIEEAEETESLETKHDESEVPDLEEKSDSDNDFDLLFDNESLDDSTLTDSPLGESSRIDDLPVPDESIDFEEFSLEDGDVSSEDLHNLSEPKIESSELDDSEFSTEDKSSDDENITLSDDELGNILGNEDELPTLTDIVEEDSSAISDNFLDENEADEEPISLTPDELTNIIGEIPPGEDLDEIDTLGFESTENENVSELRPSLDINEEDSEEEIDLDEYALEGSLSPLEELRSSPSDEAIEKKSDDSLKSDSQDGTHSDSDLSSEDKKKVLTYLDNLLGNLPDDLIREFSKSNYFELYKKMMKEIGL
jgi:hypothetical protein